VSGRDAGRELSPEDRLARLDRLAWLLDDWVRIPLTPWRIGIDGLLGLIPGLGDIVAGALSAWILIEAWRLRAPGPLLARMISYVLLDVVIGAVPIGGDVFDIAWKANRRNVRLLARHLREGETRPDGGAGTPDTEM
jgi:hypothetical protein